MIDLPENDLSAVDFMIHYLYLGDYLDLPPVPLFGRGDNDEIIKHARHYGLYRDSIRVTRISEGYHSMANRNLLLHTRLYAIAEQYNIVGLKQLAKDKFATAIKSNPGWHPVAFVASLQYMFEHLPETNLGLKSIAIEAAREHLGDLCLMPVFNALCEENNEIACSILREVGKKSLRDPQTDQASRCDTCSTDWCVTESGGGDKIVTSAYYTCKLCEIVWYYVNEQRRYEKASE